MLFPSSDYVHNALAQILGKSLLHLVEFLVSLHNLQGAGCVGRDLRIAQLLEEVVKFLLEIRILEIVNQTRDEVVEPFAVGHEGGLLAVAKRVAVLPKVGSQSADFGVGMREELLQRLPLVIDRHGSGLCKNLHADGMVEMQIVGLKLVGHILGHGEGRQSFGIFIGRRQFAAWHQQVAIADDGGNEEFLLFCGLGEPRGCGLRGDGRSSRCAAFRRRLLFGCSFMFRLWFTLRLLNRYGSTFADQLADLGNEQGLVYLEHGGTLLYIHLPNDGARNDCDALHHALDEFGTLDGIARTIAQQEVDLELDEIDLVAVYVCLILLGVMLAGKAIGVVAIGEEEDADIHPLGQKHIYTSEAGLDTRGIAIVENRDIIGEAVDEANLAGSERGARRGHDILNAALVHGNHVGVAFDEVAAIVLDDGSLGKVKAIEFVALVVDTRLGRIDVFGQFLVAGENTSTECHHLARNGMDGEDDAAMIAVEEATVVCLVAEARLFEKLGAVALGDGCAGHSIAVGEAIAKLELADNVVAKTALAEIGFTHGHAIYMVVKQVDEIVARPFVEHKQALALGGLRFLLVGELALLDFNTILLGQPFESLGIAHLLVLHDEMDHVAALAAGEALAQLLGRRNHETGSLLVVERAQTLIVDTGLAQGHKFLDDINNVGCVEDAGYGGLIYQGT